MKHLMLILLFLCTTNFFGQEICNNGIDDDGNGYGEKEQPENKAGGNNFGGEKIQPPGI